MHWAARYIGEPWELGVSDCWHFVRRVYAEQFQIDVPMIHAPGPIAKRHALQGHEELDAWRQVDDPTEGDGVMMASGRLPSHVGIWISPGGVLHSISHIGVIFTPVDRLAGLGLRVVGYYRK